MASKKLSIRSLAGSLTCFAAANFYHYDVLWYAELIEDLRASHMIFFYLVI